LQRCVCAHARAHVARDRTRCRAARHARGHGLVLLHTRVCYTHTSPTSTRASTTSTMYTPPHIYLLTHHREQTRGGGADAEAETWQEVEKQKQEQKRLENHKQKHLRVSARACCFLPPVFALASALSRLWYIMGHLVRGFKSDRGALLFCIGLLSWIR